MDGLEPVKEKAKNLVSLQSGTISPLQMASQAVKKFGTVQVTGVYITPASSYPLQEFLCGISLSSMDRHQLSI